MFEGIIPVPHCEYSRSRLSLIWNAHLSRSTEDYDRAYGDAASAGPAPIMDWVSRLPYSWCPRTRQPG